MDWDSPFFSAVKSGDISTVKSELIRGIDVNARNTKGSTALMAASYFGHDKIVIALLKYNADVDLQNDAGYTALIIAINTEFKGGIDGLQIVKLLVDAGADINIKLNDEPTWRIPYLIYGSHPISEFFLKVYYYYADISEIPEVNKWSRAQQRCLVFQYLTNLTFIIRSYVWHLTDEEARKEIKSVTDSTYMVLDPSVLILLRLSPTKRKIVVNQAVVDDDGKVNFSSYTLNRDIYSFLKDIKFDKVIIKQYGTSILMDNDKFIDIENWPKQSYGSSISSRVPKRDNVDRLEFDLLF